MAAAATTNPTIKTAASRTGRDTTSDVTISQITLGDEYGRFCAALSAAGAVGTTSTEFASLDANPQRVQYVLALQDQFEVRPLKQHRLLAKEATTSDKFRKDGNAMYSAKKNEYALQLYTKSIASAPCDSETLGLGYGNRSAVLFEAKYYRECLEDIYTALRNHYPKKLQDKLNTRKARALAFLKIEEESNSSGSSTSPTPTPSSKPLSAFVPCPELPTIPQNLCNAAISSAASNVAIKYTFALGRHVVATRDIQIGDIIAIESPYAKLVLPDQSALHCHHCLKLCYNLRPCIGCTYALYCSKACGDAAKELYHKYECPIVCELVSLGVNRLYHLALRIVIQARTAYNLLASYPKGHDLYESNRYQEIHKLIGNTKHRTVADLFERTFNAAYLFRLISEQTQFFVDNKGTENVFQDLLLLHLQTGPCNFHEISELVGASLGDDEGCSSMVEIGAGAYSFLSLFNHSCSPNVVRHCYKSGIVVRALASIRKGQQILDNYGYHHALHSRDSRQKQLKTQYFFDCACEACNKNFPLYDNLAEKNFIIELPDEEMMELRRGTVSIDELQRITRSLLIKTSILEKMKPCKNLSNIQECLKQCFALTGNRRFMF